MAEEHKFEIGSQWKTKGGWRAIVLNTHINGFWIWHNNPSIVLSCDSQGEGVRGTKYDLETPWKEPVVHEGWVRMHKYKADVDTRGFYKNKPMGMGDDCTDLVKVKFTEGEGLD